MPKIREEGHDGRAGDIVKCDGYLIENTTLNSIVPHIGSVENRRLRMTAELSEKQYSEDT